MGPKNGSTRIALLEVGQNFVGFSWFPPLIQTVVCIRWGSFWKVSWRLAA